MMIIFYSNSFYLENSKYQLFYRIFQKYFTQHELDYYRIILFNDNNINWDNCTRDMLLSYG